jgi:hypothetical protein
VNASRQATRDWSLASAMNASCDEVPPSDALYVAVERNAFL